MTSKDITIKVKDISKRYRIGMKEKIHDSFGGAIFDFIKSPLNNYRKYRSLYKFGDLDPNYGFDSNSGSSDIIWALRGVSFDVKKGEVLGIIGGNGAGKSTLLKILCRITAPTGGQAEIRGRVASLLEVGTGFHPELTGRENVFLNGTVLGMTKKEVDHKFDAIVEFSGVEKFIDTPVKRYSSGMKVRLAFAVAAHLEPEILIVDEVLAVGDAAFQKKCLDKMENVGERGRTVLFVSHNMSAITRLCERAILLESGRAVKDGPSHEVVTAYLNSGQSTPPAREWQDSATAPGDDIARLRAVRIRNGDGEVTAAVDVRQPVVIEMEYEVLTPGLTLLPHFTVNNQAGLCIFVGLDQDAEWKERPRPIGKYVSRAWIPGNLLAEGTLFVGPALRTVEPDMFHFGEQNAVAFEVIDGSTGNSARGDYVKSIPGVIRPLLQWNTRYEPNGSATASNIKKGTTA